MTELRFGASEDPEFTQAQALRGKNLELQREKMALASENENLKRQHHEFLELSAKLQKVAEDKMEQVRKSNALESENKELKAKLEILIQKNSDCAGQVEALKRASETERIAMNKRFETQLHEMTLESNRQSSSNVKRENELNAIIEEKERQIQKLESEMASLFRVASERYGRTVRDFDTLLMVLSQEHQERVVQPVARETGKEEALRKLKKKNKRLRERFALVDAEMEEQLADMRNEFLRKEDDLNAQLFVMRRNSEMQQQKINDLITKNNELTLENAKLSAQMQAIPPRPKEPTVDYRVENERLRKKNEALKQNVRVLKQQMATSISQNNSMQNEKLSAKMKLRENESEICRLKTEVTHLRGETVEAQTENARLAEALDQLKQKIVNVQRESERKDQVIGNLEMEVEEIEMELEQSKQTLAKQAKDVADQQQEVSKYLSMLQAQKFMQVKMEEEISRLQAAKAEFEVAEKPKKKVEVAIPLDCFCCELFPPTISRMIKEIATNPTLRPQAKVKQVITLLYQHSRDMGLDLQEENKSLRYVYEQKTADYKTIFDTLLRAFPIPGVNTIDTTNSARLVDAIMKKTRDQEETLARVKDKEQRMQSLLTALEADNILEGERNLDRLKTAMRKMNKKIDHQRHKIKLLHYNYDHLLVENDSLKQKLMTKDAKPEPELLSDMTPKELILKLNEESEKRKAAEAELRKKQRELNEIKAAPQKPSECRTRRLQSDIEYRASRARRRPSDSDCNTSTSSQTELSSQLRKSQLKIESLKAEMENEKKLLLASATAEGLKREANLQELIRQLKAELEKTKKDLMTFVGCQFSSLIDVNEKFTDDSFRRFIKRIRAEMERLTQTERNVRHMFSVPPGQSLEDSLSSYTK